MSDKIPNTAAIITGNTSGKYVEVKEAPYLNPREDQLLIKTIAYAVNPTDWKHVEYGFHKVGAIAGSDASGVVEYVGSKVSGFSKGDFVSTFLHGQTSEERGAFAKFVVADPQLTVKYDKKFPVDALDVGDHAAGVIHSFEGAASVTLGLSTVALSFSGNLGISPLKSANSDKYILIWGGATATGILAIQIAKHIYGLNVITTASPKNHEFLKSLGADEIYNYHEIDVLEKLSKYDFTYALDIVSSKETFQSVYEATFNSKHVKIDNLLFLGEKDVKSTPNRKGSVEFVPNTLAYIAEGSEMDAYGQHWKISDDTFKKYKEFWYELLPPFVPQLKHANLKVLKEGFESANEGFQLLKDGKVSAQKIVFRA